MSAELPPLPVCQIAADVQQQLLLLAFQTFTSKPGEGSAVEGFLSGHQGAADTTISGISAENEEIQPIGRWQVRRRVKSNWSAADDALLPESGVLLLVAPVTIRRADAVLWQRRDGVPVAWRTVFQDGTSVPKQPVARTKTEPAATPEEPKRMARLKLRVDGRQFMRWLGAVCMATGLWMTVTWVGSVNQAAGGTAPLLHLDAHGEGETIRVHWKEELGGDWAKLESATLLLRRGSEEETVDLSDRYVPEGEINVPAPAGDVAISLRIRRDGLPIALQTVTYIVPSSQPESPEEEIASLRKRVEDLEERIRAQHRNK